MFDKLRKFLGGAFGSSTQEKTEPEISILVQNLHAAIFPDSNAQELSAEDKYENIHNHFKFCERKIRELRNHLTNEKTTKHYLDTPYEVQQKLIIAMEISNKETIHFTESLIRKYIDTEIHLISSLERTRARKSTAPDKNDISFLPAGLANSNDTIDFDFLETSNVHPILMAAPERTKKAAISFTRWAKSLQPEQFITPLHPPYDKPFMSCF